jgi:hypothetical protein
MPVAVTRGARASWRMASLTILAAIASSALICEVESTRVEVHDEFRCVCGRPLDVTPEQLAELERALAEKEARLETLRSP